MFAQSFEKLLQTHCPLELVRAVSAGGGYADLTAEIEQSGFLDVLRPEADGGAGLSLAEFAPLVILCGAYLCPMPYASETVSRKWQLPAEQLNFTIRGALLAAIMAGALGQVFDLTLAHVTTRTQFGQPLVKFQAIQQQLAQMAEELVAARTAVAIAFGGSDFTLERTAVAKMRVGEAATFICATAHQLHGAIGVTADYDLSLYTRTLWAWQREAGNASHWATKLGRARVRSGLESVPFCQANFATGGIAGDGYAGV